MCETEGKAKCYVLGKTQYSSPPPFLLKANSVIKS